MGPFIHVLCIQTSDGWYLQCLDYDIGAQGKSLEAAEHAFVVTWNMHAQFDREQGREPFSLVGPAPDKYIEMAEGLAWTRKDLFGIEADDESGKNLPVHAARTLTTSMTKRDSVPLSAP